VIGGTVAATAAAWAVSGSAAAAAEHPALSSHVTHSDSAADWKHSSSRSAHKFVKDAKAATKSTVDSAGKPLGKTVRTTVKDVGSTAWDTLNAAPKVRVENTHEEMPDAQDMRDAAHRFGDDTHKAGEAAVTGTATTIKDVGSGVDDTLTSVGGKMADDSKDAFDHSAFDKIKSFGEITGGQGPETLPIFDGPTVYPIDNLTQPVADAVTAPAPPTVTDGATAIAPHTVDSTVVHSKSIAGNRHLPAGGLPSSPADDNQNPPAPITMPGTGSSTGTPSTVGGNLAADAPYAAFLARPGNSMNYRSAEVQLPVSPGKQPGTSPD
jgi:hypothetical protein